MKVTGAVAPESGVQLTAKSSRPTPSRWMVALLRSRNRRKTRLRPSYRVSDSFFESHEPPVDPDRAAIRRHVLASVEASTRKMSRSFSVLIVSSYFSVQLRSPSRLSGFLVRTQVFARGAYLTLGLSLRKVRPLLCSPHRLVPPVTQRSRQVLLNRSSRTICSPGATSAVCALRVSEPAPWAAPGGALDGTRSAATPTIAAENTARPARRGAGFLMLSPHRLAAPAELSTRPDPAHPTTGKPLQGLAKNDIRSRCADCVQSSMICLRAVPAASSSMARLMSSSPIRDETSSLTGRRPSRHHWANTGMSLAGTADPR